MANRHGPPAISPDEPGVGPGNRPGEPFRPFRFRAGRRRDGGSVGTTLGMRTIIRQIWTSFRSHLPPPPDDAAPGKLIARSPPTPLFAPESGCDPFVRLEAK
jgi:hypothetical protein